MTGLSFTSNDIGYTALSSSSSVLTNSEPVFEVLEFGAYLLEENMLAKHMALIR